ncbi:MAG: dienelactone hydrolase family protein, partial [Bacteroidota bacterium]
LIAILLASADAMAQMAGFTLTGDPASANGATWSYQQTIDGTVYDLRGVLLKPPGSGAFPAVIINHGTGGNANGYSRTMARNMVRWGYVCIATNYCHAAGVPIGSPGDTSQIHFGASTSNYQRGMKCWDILASLRYVDTNCIMAFGHSRGAYLTTGLVATFPSKFSAAGHTAGGLSMQSGFSAPTPELAAKITCPYIIHHGDADNVVPIAMDSLLQSVLLATGVTHKFFRYSGYTHSSISQDSLMLARTHEWFSTNGCSVSTSVGTSCCNDELVLFPNPAAHMIQFNAARPVECRLYDFTGQLLFSRLVMPSEQIDVSYLSDGVYTASTIFDGALLHHKLIIRK